jgi:hypothetical protein
MAQRLEPNRRFHENMRLLHTTVSRLGGQVGDLPTYQGDGYSAYRNYLDVIFSLF